MADFSYGPDEGWTSNPQFGPPVQVAPPLTTHDIQASAEGVVMDDDGKLEFLGERFKLADRIGLMPMLAFANASKEGLDSDDMSGLAAMYALVRDVVDQTRPPKLDPATGEQSIDSTGEPEWDGPSDWMRFEKHATLAKAEGEDLMDFISRAMAVVSARPRKRREVSSSSSPRTSEKSRHGLSSQVMPAQVDGLTAVADLGR